MIVAFVNEDSEPRDTSSVLGTAQELFEKNRKNSALATVGKARSLEFGEDFTLGSHLRLRVIGEATNHDHSQLTMNLNTIMQDIMETRGGTVEPLEAVEFISCLGA